jgi:hypothetical protein
MRCRLEGQKYNIMINALAPVAGTRMTESLMTPEVLAKLKPEFVSPMVAYLCSEQCQRTGEIWSAGAGYFARIEYREAPGLRSPVAPQPWRTWPTTSTRSPTSRPTRSTGPRRRR